MLLVLGQIYVSGYLRFHKDIKSSVTVNGQLSQWFAIQRGCRQGDPISSYLFVLCVEILSIMIRQNKNIKGIFIGETEYKISQYANDTEITLEGYKNSFEEKVVSSNVSVFVQSLFSSAEHWYFHSPF